LNLHTGDYLLDSVVYYNGSEWVVLAVWLDNGMLMLAIRSDEPGSGLIRETREVRFVDVKIVMVDVDDE